MDDREHILAEVQRLAAQNGGQPVGRTRFLRDTAIRNYAIDRLWLRWNDVLSDAGFEPNAMQTAYLDSDLLDMLTTLVREVGHYPLVGEIKLKRARDPKFPNSKTFARLGSKAVAVRRLAEHCSLRPDLADVVALLGDVGSEPDVPRLQLLNKLGHVYLIKSGKHYKIGQTNDLARRAGEIRIQLPERMEIVHQIETDDPRGIERYWHQRFEHGRANGEWFALTAAEVAAFKRRRFM